MWPQCGCLGEHAASMPSGDHRGVRHRVDTWALPLTLAVFLFYPLSSPPASCRLSVCLPLALCACLCAPLSPRPRHRSWSGPHSGGVGDAGGDAGSDSVGLGLLCRLDPNRRRPAVSCAGLTACPSPRLPGPACHSHTLWHFPEVRLLVAQGPDWGHRAQVCLRERPAWPGPRRPLGTWPILFLPPLLVACRVRTLGAGLQGAKNRSQGSLHLPAKAPCHRELCEGLPGSTASSRRVALRQPCALPTAVGQPRRGRCRPDLCGPRGEAGTRNPPRRVAERDLGARLHHLPRGRLPGLLRGPLSSVLLSDQHVLWLLLVTE